MEDKIYCDVGATFYDPLFFLIVVKCDYSHAIKLTVKQFLRMLQTKKISTKKETLDEFP